MTETPSDDSMHLRGDLDNIVQWVERNAPDGAPMFSAAASSEAIAKCERVLGVTFPPAIRTLYRLADGQPNDAARLLDAFALVTLDEIVEAATFLNDFFPGGMNVENPDHAPMELDDLMICKAADR